MTFDSILRKVKSHRKGHKPAPRDLPTEELIQRTFFSIKNLEHRAQYAYLAVFGLRNHEVYNMDIQPLLSGKKIIYVSNETKTDFRVACALYPEWIDTFSLRDLKPPSPRPNYNNGKHGALVTSTFGKLKIPFSPYDLRHCWARRSIAFGMDPRIAALCMGHSLETHFKFYCHWFDEETINRELERIERNPNRPKPPPIDDAPES